MAAISCEPFLPEFPEESVEAYRPIYADDESVMISKESGRDIKTAGKIFVYGDVLLINELNEGIHVYDNTDPTKPENLFFIAIPGNTDMSMSNGLLYANNMADLVTINISLSTFEVTQRFEGLFLDETAFSPDGRTLENVAWPLLDTVAYALFETPKREHISVLPAGNRIGRAAQKWLFTREAHVLPRTEVRVPGCDTYRICSLR